MKINFPPARILTARVTGNYEFNWSGLTKPCWLRHGVVAWFQGTV